MKVYCDGSAHPNPGQGGYGIVVYDDNDKYISCYSHQESMTTNNIQELKAILFSLAKYGNIPNVTVYSDSSYAVNTYTTWMWNWANNGWVKSDKKVPDNLEIIQAYYDLILKGHKINLVRIKGHCGIEGNEIADKLATGIWKTQDVEEYFYKKEKINAN